MWQAVGLKGLDSSFWIATLRTFHLPGFMLINHRKLQALSKKVLEIIPFSSVIVGLSPPSYPKRHKRLVLCTGFLGNESTGDGGQDWQGLKDTKDAKFVPGTT